MGININNLHDRLNLDVAASLSGNEGVLDQLRELSAKELRTSGGSESSSNSAIDSESFSISLPDFDSSLDSIPVPSFSPPPPVTFPRPVYYSYFDGIDIDIDLKSSSR